MQHHPILHLIAKLLMPFILVFSLYVLFHAEYGPGGGFQNGVIFGAGLILYGIIFGKDAAMKVAPPAVVHVLAATGVLIYVFIGIAGMFLGGEFLNYSVLLPSPVSGQKFAIIFVEAGVGLTVASVMIALFYSYSMYKHTDSSEQS